MITRHFPYGLLLLLASLSPFTAFADDTDVPLGVGLSTVLKLSGVRRISIANPRIADVKVVDAEVLVTGTGVGRTSLLVWKRNGQKLSYLVVVSSDETLQAFQEIKRLVKDVEGIRIRLAVDHIVLEGDVYSPEDALLVEKLGSTYPKEVRTFVLYDGVPLPR